MGASCPAGELQAKHRDGPAPPGTCLTTHFSFKEEGKGEDSVKLKLALKMARKDLTKAQVELNTMKANYGDVVPRREFELQEQKYQDLSEKVLRVLLLPAISQEAEGEGGSHSLVISI